MSSFLLVTLIFGCNAVNDIIISNTLDYLSVKEEINTQLTSRLFYKTWIQKNNQVLKDLEFWNNLFNKIDKEFFDDGTIQELKEIHIKYLKNSHVFYLIKSANILKYDNYNLSNPQINQNYGRVLNALIPDIMDNFIVLIQQYLQSTSYEIWKGDIWIIFEAIYSSMQISIKYCIFDSVSISIPTEFNKNLFEFAIQYGRIQYQYEFIKSYQSAIHQQSWMDFCAPSFNSNILRISFITSDYTITIKLRARYILHFLRSIPENLPRRNKVERSKTSITINKTVYSLAMYAYQPVAEIFVIMEDIWQEIWQIMIELFRFEIDDMKRMIADELNQQGIEYSVDVMFDEITM